ncbi:formin [Xyrichtys novacula]|uniref:Formin n=1 Tax=Xyrichtys novacula TaxID=13765 RepID=A0AAV1GYL2_XYRNO|nr:formin [Xyrichtys novacula]
MESTHKNLHLYSWISERSCVSPSLFDSRGPASPSQTPLKHQQGFISNEDGLAETLKLGQADNFSLADFKQALKVLEDSPESHLLTELLLLCLECQEFMSMGNQQGIKVNSNFSFSENRDTLTKSPRTQLFLKRRRGLDDTFKQNVKTASPTPRVPLKARRLMKLHLRGSPTFGEWDLKEDKSAFHTPALRRKRFVEKGSVLPSGVRDLFPQELEPAWRIRQPDTTTSDFHCSAGKRGIYFPPESVSEKEDCVSHESDRGLSEYDNDRCFSFTGFGLKRKTEVGIKGAQKTNINQEEVDTYEGNRAKDMKERTFHWRDEETEKEAAAQRVISKIEEVEGIIHRVSHTSSDWIKDGSPISDGCLGDERNRGHTESDSKLQRQNKEHTEDKPVMVDEFQALGEALSQSLREVLKMEGAKAGTNKSFQKTNHVGSSRRYLHLSHLPSFTPPERNTSASPILLAVGETSPAPTQFPSPVRDASPRTFTSFKDMSPILSPLFTSRQHSPPLSQTDWHEKDSWRCPRKCTSSSEEGKIPQGFGDCGGAKTDSYGAENDQKKNKKLEQNEAMLFRCSSQTEICPDLLSSDEALQRQEELWQQEVEESLSFCSSLSHPSRPKHIDFLRITPPEDDIIDTPTTTPLPEFQVQPMTSDVDV